MVAKLAGRLMTTAARRGLLGGSRPWLVVLVILVGGRPAPDWWSERAIIICVRTA